MASQCDFIERDFSTASNARNTRHRNWSIIPVVEQSILASALVIANARNSNVIAGNFLIVGHSFTPHKVFFHFDYKRLKISPT